MIRTLAALWLVLTAVLIAAYREMPDDWKEGRATCLYRDATGALQLRC